MTTSSPSTLLDSLSALNDSARLRVLHLLSEHELSVGEVADVLQLPQSTVSRHLKLLLDSEFVARRTHGTTGLYRLCDTMPSEAADLWRIAAANSRDLPGVQDDESRLISVLAQRQTDSRSFFKNVGSDWELLRYDLYGSQFTSIALLSLLDPTLRVVDIGCGIGNVATLISPYVKSVIAVDRESSMLTQARQRPDVTSEIDFREGDALNLPLQENSVDVAMFCLVLHHIESPSDALCEAARVVTNGGRVLIIDMQEHVRDEYKHTMGHLHQGFSETDIQTMARKIGDSTPTYHRLQPDTEARGPSLFAAILTVTH